MDTDVSGDLWWGRGSYRLEREHKGNVWEMEMFIAFYRWWLQTWNVYICENSLGFVHLLLNAIFPLKNTSCFFWKYEQIQKQRAHSGPQLAGGDAQTTPLSIVTPDPAPCFLLPACLPTAPGPTTWVSREAWVRSPPQPPAPTTSGQTDQTPVVFLPGIWKPVSSLHVEPTIQCGRKPLNNKDCSSN